MSDTHRCSFSLFGWFVYLIFQGKSIFSVFLSLICAFASKVRALEKTLKDGKFHALNTAVLWNSFDKFMDIFIWDGVQETTLANDTFQFQLNTTVTSVAHSREWVHNLSMTESQPGGILVRFCCSSLLSNREATSELHGMFTFDLSSFWSRCVCLGLTSSQLIDRARFNFRFVLFFKHQFQFIYSFNDLCIGRFSHQ